MKQILHDITVLFTHMIITVDFFCSILGQVRDLLLSRFGATDRMFLVVFQGDPELQNSAVFFRTFGQQTHGKFQQCPTNHPYGEPQKQNISKKTENGDEMG